MNLIVERSDVWAAGFRDEPGGLAQVLKTLKDAGADLDFILARRNPEAPGEAVAFVTPLRGDREVAAAAEAGFCVASSIHSVRVQGQNRPGLAADVAGKLAAAKLNIRGFSAAELGTRFVMYIAMDSEADAERAVQVLRRAWQPVESGWERSAA
jgi:hypothetical protein